MPPRTDGSDAAEPTLPGWGKSPAAGGGGTTGGVSNSTKSTPKKPRGPQRPDRKAKPGSEEPAAPAAPTAPPHPPRDQSVAGRENARKPYPAEVTAAAAAAAAGGTYPATRTRAETTDAAWKPWAARGDAAGTGSDGVAGAVTVATAAATAAAATAAGGKKRAGKLRRTASNQSIMENAEANQVTNPSSVPLAVLVLACSSLHHMPAALYYSCNQSG